MAQRPLTLTLTPTLTLTLTLTLPLALTLAPTLAFALTPTPTRRRWVNLPKKHKMQAPRYQPILAAAVPVVQLKAKVLLVLGD